MSSASFLGRKKRLDRITEQGRMLVTPVDDSLIMGPEGGLKRVDVTLQSLVSGKPTAILGYRGSYSLLERIDKGLCIPFIVNVTASTDMGQHIKKIRSSSVIDALIMGADCVAVHINYCNSYENDMLENLANIISDADKYGMPVLAIAYPRRTDKSGKDDNFLDEKNTDLDAYTKRVCHCVRSSAELGADIIKTQYTGSSESFKRVVDSAMGKPVIIAGGPAVSIEKSFLMARNAMDAGAAGISFGRNVFNAENIEAYLAGLKAIVFNDSSVSDALEVYKEKSSYV